MDPGNKFGLGLGGVGGSKAYFLLFYHVNFKFEFSRGVGFRPSPPQDPHTTELRKICGTRNYP